MRYIAAMLLAVAIGITASVPAALAGSENAGDTTYANGVVSSTVQPAPLTLISGSESGALAGPLAPNHIPFYGGDKD